MSTVFSPKVAVASNTSYIYTVRPSHCFVPSRHKLCYQIGRPTGPVICFQGRGSRVLPAAPPTASPWAEQRAGHRYAHLADTYKTYHHASSESRLTSHDECTGIGYRFLCVALKCDNWLDIGY